MTRPEPQQSRERWDREYLADRNLPTSKNSPTHISDHTASFHAYLDRYAPAVKTVLDIGCGQGNDTIYFAKQGYDARGCDISPVAVRIAGRNASNQGITRPIFDLCDLTGPWPYATGSFDAAYDGTTFINLITDKDRENYITELIRTLRPKAPIQFVLPVLPDGFYSGLMDAQGSSTVTLPSGIVQNVYAHDEFIALLTPRFHIERQRIAHKRNVMFGVAYDRTHLRVVVRT